MGGLPLAVIPHPIADNRPHEVRAKAEAIADEIVAILTRDANELDATYRPLYHRLAETRLKRGATCVDDVCIADPAGAAAQPSA
jgi:hypothetical protein